MNDEEHLDASLARFCAQARTITYAELTVELGLTGAGRIAHLTSMLEATMDADATAARPLRAAVVVSRATKALPARGFFLKAEMLGYFQPALETPALFHQHQLAAVFAVSER